MAFTDTTPRVCTSIQFRIFAANAGNRINNSGMGKGL